MKQLYVIILLSVFASILLQSCRSGDEAGILAGKKITICGELVKGPSGYMIFSGDDLESVYLMQSPDTLSDPGSTRKFRDFISMNDGRRISVTGTLFFKRIDDVSKSPEETEKPPAEYYLIYWDAKDTLIDAK